MGAAQKIYNITVNVQIKRGKEEIEYASRETDKLYNLIATGTETDWAKTRIVRIQDMIFKPSADELKTELLKKLEEADNETK